VLRARYPSAAAWGVMSYPTRWGPQTRRQVLKWLSPLAPRILKITELKREEKRFLNSLSLTSSPNFYALPSPNSAATLRL
jgi:hypothetical protein